MMISARSLAVVVKQPTRKPNCLIQRTDKLDWKKKDSLEKQGSRHYFSRCGLVQSPMVRLYFSRKDVLGKSLEEVCSIVPGGSLLYFQAIKLMEKLCTRLGNGSALLERSFRW